MIAIVGATGNTGKVAAEALLGRGEKVRAIGRTASRLEALVAKGAEAFVADVTDANALTKAFSGAHAAFVMIPPSLVAPDIRAYQEKVSDAQSQALEKAGVEYAVLLSSIGADKPDKTGPILGLHTFEQKLGAIAQLNVYQVRAGYFMENMLPQTEVIKRMGTVAGPLKADLALPMIATRDIGAFVAEKLHSRDFSGKKVSELLGHRELNYNEATKIMGGAIGKPNLSYTQPPSFMLKMALTSMGMSKSMADGLLEMAEGLNSGYIKALDPRSPANTTPTSFEQFVAQVFVPAFNAKAAAA